MVSADGHLLRAEALAKFKNDAMKRRK